MKIRNGFVSNSSSSSFTVYRNEITRKQSEQILDHRDEDFISNWSFYSDGKKIVGTTTGADSDMRSHLEAIGIDEALITWEHS